MRRILNLPLLAATLVTLGFAMWALTVFGTEERQLKIAKQDAFTSIHALWRARAAAYSANADESRYLLDAENATQAEQDFFRKAGLLMKLPPGVTAGQLAEDALNAQDQRIGVKFTGYFADELNNITFRGEREAAAQTIQNFGDYLTIDSQIRRLQQTGKHAQAIELCVGTQPGQSDYAFDQFDRALDRTIAINQSAFDAAVETGFAALSHFEEKSAVAAVIIGLLILAGLMQRIAEYR